MFKTILIFLILIVKNNFSYAFMNEDKLSFIEQSNVRNHLLSYPKVSDCRNKFPEINLSDTDDLFQRIAVFKKANFVSLKFLNKQNNADCLEAFLFNDGTIIINNINNGVKTKGKALLIKSNNARLDLNKIYKNFSDSNNLLQVLERKKDLNKLHDTTMSSKKPKIIGDCFQKKDCDKSTFLSYLGESPSWPYWFDSYYGSQDTFKTNNNYENLIKIKKGLVKEIDVNDAFSWHFKHLFMSYLFAAINYGEQEIGLNIVYQTRGGKTFIKNNSTDNSFNFWAAVLKLIEFNDNEETHIFGNNIFNNGNLVFNGEAIIFTSRQNNICGDLYEIYPEELIISNRGTRKNCLVEFNKNEIKPINNNQFHRSKLSKEKLFKTLSAISKKCELIDQNRINDLTNEQQTIVKKNQQACKKKIELNKISKFIKSRFNNEQLEFNCLASKNMQDKYPSKIKQFTFKTEKPFQTFLIKNEGNNQTFNFDIMLGNLIRAQNIDIDSNDKYLIIDFDNLHFWLINNNHINDILKSPAGTPQRSVFNSRTGAVFMNYYETYKCDDY